MAMPIRFRGLWLYDPSDQPDAYLTVAIRNDRLTSVPADIAGVANG